MFLGCSRTLYILQAWLTLPSCLASSNKPTFPLIIFWSLVIVGVLIKRRGRALRNPASSPPGLGSRFGLMTPNVRSNINYYTLGLWPPILRGATLPVSWNRRTQLITVLGATPNRAATRCRDSPPSKTAATARSRRSIDKGLAIHAGLLSSQHVESDPSRFGNPKSILPKVIPL